jgi:hypothetical protein
VFAEAVVVILTVEKSSDFEGQKSQSFMYFTMGLLASSENTKRID